VIAHSFCDPLCLHFTIFVLCLVLPPTRTHLVINIFSLVPLRLSLVLASMAPQSLTDIDNHLFTVTFLHHLASLTLTTHSLTDCVLYSGLAMLEESPPLIPVRICCLCVAIYKINIAVSLRHHLSFIYPEKRGKIACMHYKQLSKYSIGERVRLGLISSFYQRAATIARGSSALSLPAQTPLGTVLPRARAGAAPRPLGAESRRSGARGGECARDGSIFWGRAEFQ
jgi:hypothetical protein